MGMIVFRGGDSDRGGGNGTWNMESKSDPRWNKSGRAYGIFGSRTKIEQAVSDTEKALGEKPPADLEVSFWKD